MIFDIHELTEREGLSADICIIGAGAAGISLALSLAHTEAQVLLLESGGLEAGADTQALYEGEVVDEDLHSPPIRYRQRRFGGTTTIWGGRCMPYDAIDFEHRDYMPHSGWPFGIEELLPFYPEANRLCEAGDFSYRIDASFSSPRQPMIGGFRSDSFSSDSLERFSCPTNFGARYLHKLRTAKNVRVVLHANVTALQLNGAGDSVERLRASSLSGREIAVTASKFVLATGGLEVPRLLLASRDVHANGIGNQHDVVGRYYMCHVAGTVGTFKFDDTVPVWHGYDVADEGVYCRRRLALTPEKQRQLGVGNFVARLHHPRITDPAHRTGILSLLYLAKMFIPYEYGKRLHGEEKASFGSWLQHVRNVLLDPFGTIAFLWHWLNDRTLAARKFPSIIVKPRANRFSLDFHAEQQPNPASRVTLSEERDVLGLPKLRIDWRYTPKDVETIHQAVALLAEDVRRSGIGVFEYNPADLEMEMTRYGAYGGHHIGTARMGDDPRSSVVDRNCRVHGVDNLYIAGAAVFPTSSQANPTLTIVALALRLSKHLRGLLGGAQRQPASSPGTIATAQPEGVVLT